MLDLDSFLGQQLSYHSDHISLSDKSAQANSIDFRQPFSSVDIERQQTNQIDPRIEQIAQNAEFNYKARYDRENKEKLRQTLSGAPSFRPYNYDIVQNDSKHKNPYWQIVKIFISSNRSSKVQSIYSVPYETSKNPQPKTQFLPQRPALQFLYPAVTRDFYKDDKSLWVNVDPMKKLKIAPAKQAKRTPQKQKRLENQFKIYEERAIQSYLDQAKKLMKKQFYLQAIESLMKAKEKGYNHSDLYYLLGESKRQILKYQSSEKDLLKAMKFEVHSPFVYQSLGLLYKSQGKYQNAIVLIRSFIDQLQTPDAHNQLGMCYIKVKQYISAAVHFTRAIEMNPQNAWYYYNRGVAYEGQNLYQQALSDYGTSKKLDENQFKELIAAKVVSLLTKQL